MNRIEIQLKTLTPAFIGGARARYADQTTPFRPPSIRGVLRWWFRAALAGVMWPLPAVSNPDKNRDNETKYLQAFHRLESLVFGSTDAASPLLLGVPRGAQVTRVQQPGRATEAGLLYLGYGVFDGGADGIVQENKDVPITVPMILKPRAASGVDEVLAATLWLWTHLGGIGARSRRGWGSLHAVNLSGLRWTGPAFGAVKDSATAAFQQRAEGIGHVLAVFDAFVQHHAREWHNVGEQPHVAIRNLDNVFRIDGLSALHPTPLDALDFAGTLFQDYRNTLRRRQLGMPPLPDYFAVHDGTSGKSTTVRPVERAAFGLPLPFYFRSLGGAKGTVYPDFPKQKDGGKQKKLDRLASPLHFRVVPISHGTQTRYTTFFVDFSGDKRAAAFCGLNLVLETGNRSVPVATTGGTMIRTFIQWAQETEKQRRGGGRGR